MTKQQLDKLRAELMALADRIPSFTETGLEMNLYAFQQKVSERTGYFSWYADANRLDEYLQADIDPDYDAESQGEAVFTNMQYPEEAKALYLALTKQERRELAQTAASYMHGDTTEPEDVPYRLSEILDQEWPSYMLPNTYLDAPTPYLTKLMQVCVKSLTGKTARHLERVNSQYIREIGEELERRQNMEEEVTS